MLELLLFAVLGLGQMSQVVDMPEVHVSSVNVYGVRTTDPEAIWRAIRLDLGGPVPKTAPIQRRLESIDGVEGAEISVVHAGSQAAVFIGIRESAKAPAPPAGSDPLLARLASHELSDRFAGAKLLARATRDRDPELLGALQAHSLPSLLEMARWHSRRHARYSLEILSRVTGERESDIQARLESLPRDPEAQWRWLEAIEERLAAHQRFVNGELENPLGDLTRTVSGAPQKKRVL